MLLLRHFSFTVLKLFVSEGTILKGTVRSNVCLFLSMNVQLLAGYANTISLAVSSAVMEPFHVLVLFIV